MDDAMELRIFLLDEANLNAKIVDRTVELLEEQECFGIKDLEIFVRLPAFTACGFKELTAERIRAAVAARGDVAAASGAPIGKAAAPLTGAAQTGAVSTAAATPPKAGRTRSAALTTPSAPTRRLFAEATPSASPVRPTSMGELEEPVAAAEPVAVAAAPISFNFGGPVAFTSPGTRVTASRAKAVARAVTAAAAAKENVEAAVEAAEAPWRAAAAEATRRLLRLQWLEALVCYEVPLDFWDGASFGFWGEREAAAVAEQRAADLADPLDALSEAQLAAMNAEPGTYSRAQLVALDLEWLAEVPEWAAALTQQFIARNGHAGKASVGIPSHIRHARGYGTGGGGKGGSMGGKGGTGGKSFKGGGKGGGADGGRHASQHLKGNSISAASRLLVPANASARSGAHDATDLSRGTPPFVLTRGSPDERYPWKLRWDRWQWLTVELYDKWLRGATLEAADFPEDDAYEIQQGEPQSEAARVTWLINRVPRSLAWLNGDMDMFIDASRPAASQLDAFARMGWPAPPTACELVCRMVDGVKADYGEHRPKPGKGVYVHSQRDYFLEVDSAEGSEGARAPAGMVAAYSDDADYDAYDGDEWDCDAECEAEDACAAYAAQAGAGGA